MMMDNAAHHQVAQLSTTSSQSASNIQQQHHENKLSNEPDHFLTIRLLMQGKVSSIVLLNLILFFIIIHMS